MGIVEAQLVAQADNGPVNSIRHLPTLILDHNVARKRRAAIADGVLHRDTVTLRCKTLKYCSAAWRWLGTLLGLVGDAHDEAGGGSGAPVQPRRQGLELWFG